MVGRCYLAAVCGCLVAAASGVAAESTGPDDKPPPQEIELDFSATGSSKLTAGGGALVEHQSASFASLSFLERQPLGAASWYFDWGAQDENYEFGNSRGFSIDRLQDVAANFSLEYFIKSESVASFTISPGLYFQNHPGDSSWDAPVELVSGVPIVDAVSGVLGAMDGRLYHHPLPIAGLVWTISPSVRLEAVYPNPALTVTCSPDLEAKLTGELVGGAFETDPTPVRTRVEYYGYRVGASLAYKLGQGFEVTGGGGVELEREFDFYQESKRIDAARAPYLELSVVYR